MLRKFAFPFEKLLKIKNYRTKEAQRALSQSLKILQTRMNDLSALQANETREKKHMGYQLRKPRVVIEPINISLRYLANNQAEIIFCNDDIRKLETDVESKRGLLVAASREEEKFKKYREKTIEKYKLRQNREMNKQIDETASRMRKIIVGENILSSRK
ncbi:MAG: hypothetical protein CO189_09450 [candidate division Zixibacteria bacterium CG_4_9_14_3_um_filter_46_8]|nr:MAG: hypothetical protein CO189_09450 [candidate division Zixibacteria bacterium CG_4_9_14_3_um_filter_46_8]